MQACACCACGAPVHAAAYAGRGNQVLTRLQNRVQEHKLDMENKKKSLFLDSFNKLKQAVRCVDFNTIAQANSIVEEFKHLDEILGIINDTDHQKCIILKNLYVSKVRKFLHNIHDEFTRTSLSAPQDYERMQELYEQYTHVWQQNITIFLTFKNEEIMEQKLTMEKALGIQGRQVALEFSTMLKKYHEEMLAPKFKISTNFVRKLVNLQKEVKNTGSDVERNHFDKFYAGYKKEAINFLLDADREFELSCTAFKTSQKSKSLLKDMEKRLTKYKKLHEITKDTLDPWTNDGIENRIQKQEAMLQECATHQSQTAPASEPHATQVQAWVGPSAIMYPLNSSLHKPCTNCEYCNFYPQLVPRLPDLPCELYESLYNMLYAYTDGTLTSESIQQTNRRIIGCMLEYRLHPTIHDFVNIKDDVFDICFRKLSDSEKELTREARLVFLRHNTGKSEYIDAWRNKNSVDKPVYYVNRMAL